MDIYSVLKEHFPDLNFEQKQKDLTQKPKEEQTRVILKDLNSDFCKEHIKDGTL